MNYAKHYNLLIDRAKNRKLTGYKERHHIKPKSLGGSNKKENIAELTAEEHYLAHLLLVKIYPGNKSLINACMILCTHSSGERINNKIYGWIRRLYQKTAKERVGNKNPSYGRPWYHNPITLENGKFIAGTEPTGWKRGRKPNSKCVTCYTDIDRRITNARYCDRCRTLRLDNINSVRKLNGYRGKEKEFIEIYKSGKSINESLKILGYKSGNNGPLSKWARDIVNSLGDSLIGKTPDSESGNL
jgi:hypothetical protein